MGAGSVTQGQLKAINRLSRRELSADEVFVFSVILCDNRADRDLEQFDDSALEELAELFVGKTGVFDHKPQAENQTARIFETLLETDEAQQNQEGKPYRRLRAWAYMVRCDKNADLILEIDAGIKKEVSVSCSVQEVICSVCGANQKQDACAHQKGGEYDGVPCYHVLRGITDVYEWSFVAVPAQKNAGVIKRFGEGGQSANLAKLFDGGGAVTLSSGERQILAEEFCALREFADMGKRYLEEVRQDVVKLLLLSQPGLDAHTAKGVCGKMDLAQLKAFQTSCEKQVKKRYPTPQLAGDPDGELGIGDYKLGD